jgi:histidyl-tRNA synthetase
MQVKEPVSKLYYFGPMFRRERPQRGRLRQFSQIGAEMLGRDDPAADAEVLLLLDDLLSAFGVRSARIGINTLGCRECRPAYRDALIAWGGGLHDDLCADCKRRLEQNPMRLLDCKQVGCVALRGAAPRMLDYCCGGCREHFDRVLQLLAARGKEPELQPFMVRGLDYYCRTAFEVSAAGLGAQNAVGGGGRYDGLVGALGGQDVPGVGFALGMERLALALAECDAGGEEAGPEFFVAALGEAAEKEAFRLVHRFRTAGARVEADAGGRSLKSQMRRAGKLGCRYVIILGEDELAAAALTVRDMEARVDHPRVAGLGITLEELRAALTAAPQVEERR